MTLIDIIKNKWHAGQEPIGPNCCEIQQAFEDGYTQGHEEGYAQGQKDALEIISRAQTLFLAKPHGTA